MAGIGEDDMGWAKKFFPPYQKSSQYIASEMRREPKLAGLLDSQGNLQVERLDYKTWISLLRSIPKNIERAEAGRDKAEYGGDAKEVVDYQKRIDFLIKVNHELGGISVPINRS